MADSLFDQHKAANVDENLEYMLGRFSFFIPSIDYLTDLPGLLDYLGQKITIGYQCLYCERAFNTLPGCRRHMIDTCHCMMQWDDPDEYSEFYSFPKTGTTVSECINENGDIEDTKLAYIEPTTGELVLRNNGKIKTLGVRQYAVYYKQKDSRYMNYQLAASLVQEHKRLAAIEYQKKTNQGSIFQADKRNRLRKQGNIILHFRDQNGQVK